MCCSLLSIQLSTSFLRDFTFVSGALCHLRLFLVDFANPPSKNGTSIIENSVKNGTKSYPPNAILFSFFLFLTNSGAVHGNHS